jgi:L-histidine Nalpha-methyltransferase
MRGNLMSDTAASRGGGTKKSSSSAAGWIPTIADALKQSRSSFGFVLMEIPGTDRIGEVMNAIRGIGGESKYIKEGYQYVGDVPAHQLMLATVDDHYKTMSYGITSFHEEWRDIQAKLTSPYHYVSIGPGTGEKDREVLRHLVGKLGDGERIAYVPVDISPQLLGMGVNSGLRGIKLDKVDVLPMELDIASERELATLKIVVEELGRTAGVLISLLGNTLSNFHHPPTILSRLKSLLSSEEDRLFLELATTHKADEAHAKRAAAEYQSSDPFLLFAMETLCDYTDLPRGTDRVRAVGEIENDVVKVTTNYQLDKATKVRIGRSGSTFNLRKDEPIELIVCRKYTDSALASMLKDFGQAASHKSEPVRGFGSSMYLLSVAEKATRTARTHPVAAMPAAKNS